LPLPIFNPGTVVAHQHLKGRDESCSSQFNQYFGIIRDNSPNISVHDFRLRPEIISQFNYYRIISEFKKEKELSNQRNNS